MLTVAQVDSGWCSSMCPWTRRASSNPVKATCALGCGSASSLGGLTAFAASSAVSCCLQMAASQLQEYGLAHARRHPYMLAVGRAHLSLQAFASATSACVCCFLLVCQTQTAGLSPAFLFLGSYLATRPRRASCPRCQLSADLLITQGRPVSKLQAAEMAKSLCLLCYTSTYSHHFALLCCCTPASLRHLH